MRFLKRDAELSQLLADSDAQVARAKNNEDLLKVIATLQSFKGGLQFDHARSWLLFILAIVSAIPAMAGVLWMWFVTACLGFAALYAWMSRTAVLDELPKKIARKCSFLTNGLWDPGGTAEERLERLCGEFKDYERGNDSRRIEASAKGIYQGARHQFSFIFHHLCYVNSHYKSKSDGESERVYESFDRFSLVVDFPWVSGVKVLSDLPNKKSTTRKVFDTTSDDFNRNFIFTGDSELACAKFAMPTTLAYLLKLSRRLKKVNLEFSTQGHLCLSFDDAEVMAYKDPGTFADLPGFYANIERGLALPNLLPVLALVHELAELHDNNFDLPLTVADKTEQ